MRFPAPYNRRLKETLMRTALAAAGLALASGAVPALADYPEKPITFIAQMKMKQVPTYGNQIRIPSSGSPALAIWM